MDYTATKQYLLKKPEALEDYPFGPDAAVFKVRDKMFALLFERHGSTQVNLKCDPEQAIALRDIFEGITPGYHMNKRHWNTVILDGSVPSGEIERMIDHSFGLVVKALRKSDRTYLETQYPPKELYR